jgi:hypothetical protein
VSHIGGGDLHGVEKDGRFFGVDAAVQHHFANVRDTRLDGDGIFEEGQVGVTGRAVVEVDLRRSHYLVIVANRFAAKSGRLAGIAVALALDAKFVGIFIERRRHYDCS